MSEGTDDEQTSGGSNAGGEKRQLTRRSACGVAAAVVAGAGTATATDDEVRRLTVVSATGEPVSYEVTTSDGFLNGGTHTVEGVTVDRRDYRFRGAVTYLDAPRDGEVYLDGRPVADHG